MHFQITFSDSFTLTLFSDRMAIYLLQICPFLAAVKANTSQLQQNDNDGKKKLSVGVSDINNQSKKKNTLLICDKVFFVTKPDGNAIVYR